MIQKLEHLLVNEFDPGFQARAQFIFDAIEQYKPKKVLDAGCGRGFYSHATSFFPFVKEIQSFDVNESYLNLAKQHCTDKRIHFQKANIYSLPYSDNYFDFIVFSEVLEHLTDEKKALNELSRVLKKGGHIALTVPNSNFPFLWDPINWLLMKLLNTHINKDIWWLAGIWADHERLYSFSRLQKLFVRRLFKIVKQEESIHWSWPFAHFILYGIGKNIIEKLGITSVSRFDFKSGSIFTRFLARVIKLPSAALDQLFPAYSSVNVCVVATKKLKNQIIDNPKNSISKYR